MFYFFFCLNLFGKHCPKNVRGGKLFSPETPLGLHRKTIKKSDLKKLNKIVIFQSSQDSGEFFCLPLPPFFSAEVGSHTDVLRRTLLWKQSISVVLYGILFVSILRAHFKHKCGVYQNDFIYSHGNILDFVIYLPSNLQTLT